MIKKPNLDIHFGNIVNPKTFNQAYSYIQKNRNKNYHTTGNKTPFIAEARICKKGIHQGEKVLIFKTKTNKNFETEKARSYRCCWGYKTNCNKTHIDCFTETI